MAPVGRGLKAVFLAATALCFHLADGFGVPSTRMLRHATREVIVVRGGRKATPLGRTTTAEGKKLKVDEVGAALAGADLVFSVSTQGRSVKQISSLRRKLPPGAKTIVVKNTLMARACADKEQWAGMSGASESLMSGVNMWFFVPMDDMRATYDCYSAWLKEFSLGDTVPVKGGLFEGQLQDGPGVAAIGALPTRHELMTRIARALKAAGAQGIAIRLREAGGQKLARAIRMAFGDPAKNTNTGTAAGFAAAAPTPGLDGGAGGAAAGAVRATEAGGGGGSSEGAPQAKEKEPAAVTA